MSCKYFSAVMSVIVLAGCQANVGKEKLVSSSNQFPTNSLSYYEQPSSALEEQKQTISGSYKEKKFEVAYIKAKSGYVWLRQPEELQEKNLRLWRRMKSASFNLGSYNKMRTSIGELSYRRYKVRQNQCVFFGKYFGWSDGDDTRRPTKLLNGYFCQKPSETLEDSDIAELLNSLSLSRNTQKPITNNISNTSSQNRPSGSRVSSSKQGNDHAIKGSWEGVSDNIYGSFTTDSTSGRGRLKVQFDRDDSANAVCSGQWLWGKGKYDTSSLPQGTWSLACDDGLTAGGTYVSSTPSNGTIEGEDAQGRKLSMFFNPKSMATESNTRDSSIEKRLLKLKSLVDEGLLTKEEASEKRKEILDGL